MKKHMTYFAVLMMSATIVACSNPLGYDMAGSKINDGYEPGVPDTPPAPKQGNGKGFSISPGNQMLAKGNTVSAKAGVKVDSRVLKGSSVSVSVSINRFEPK